MSGIGIIIINHNIILKPLLTGCGRSSGSRTLGTHCLQTSNSTVKCGMQLAARQSNRQLASVFTVAGFRRRTNDFKAASEVCLLPLLGTYSNLAPKNLYQIFISALTVRLSRHCRARLCQAVAEERL